MASLHHQTHHSFERSSALPKRSRQRMDSYPPTELGEALPHPPPSLPPFGPASTADDGAFEPSAAPSLSDLVDGLPTALKSSLAPLRTIRRSVSIRGWLSYLHENSVTKPNHHKHNDDNGNTSSGSGSSSSSKKTVPLSSSSSSSSLSSAALMSPCLSPCSSASSVVAGADEEPIQCGEDEKRGSRFCARGSGIAGSGVQLRQQQQQNHIQHQHQQQQQQQQQQMNTGCRRWTRDWTSLARRQISDPKSTKRITSMSEVVEYAEPRWPAEIDRFSRVQGQLLVNNAMAESHTQPLDRDRRVRSAYVQGVAWLLTALPRDLDDHEHAELERALPGSLRRRLRKDERQAHIKRRSVIQHAVAILCLQLYAFLRLVLALVGQVVHWDRKYRVTECAAQWSARIALMVGRGLLMVLGLLYEHGGARLGAGVAGAVGYVVGEMAKGVHDAAVDWSGLDMGEGQEKHGQSHGNRVSFEMAPRWALR